MGRPAQHDEQTRAALLAVAEQLLTDHGPDAVSVRAVATVRGRRHAVYALFGAKEGLLGALAEHGFDTLGQLVQGLPVTADPIRDLVAAGMDGFRAWALAHPALYRLTFDRLMTGTSIDRRVTDAGRAALEHLRARVVRAGHAGLLGDRDIDDAIYQFHALCEGIATVELRGTLPPEHAERIAHDAFEALLNGMSNPPTAASPTRRRSARRASPAKRG